MPVASVFEEVTEAACAAEMEIIVKNIAAQQAVSDFRTECFTIRLYC
jgi:hypothetical protein